MSNVRELAVDLLMEILENQSYCHLVMRDALDKYDYLEGRDKAFLKYLTEGTVERCIQIDAVLDQFSTVKTAKMKPFIRNLLRSSVYQLYFMDSVPDSAVCNEAVKLAGKRGFRKVSGFVNGVLRNIARHRDDVAYPDPEQAFKQWLSVTASMPLWLVNQFIAEQGREHTEAMLQAFLKPQPVTIRCKDAEETVSALKEAGYAAVQHPYLPYALQLTGAEGIAHLPGYAEGRFQVQDVSSMLVCEAAGIQEGDRILDICAAPGGKSLHAAEKLKGTGHVTARDKSEQKADLIRQNAERMRAENVTAEVWDATVLSQKDREAYDIVLADLPCSGLGIIGKKPDIKYHASKESLAALAALQREILTCAMQYVKPGGVLIYSTCTVNRLENEDNVKWMTEQGGFAEEDLAPFLPRQLRQRINGGKLQLLPGVDETDGFFLARLRRR